MKTPSAAYQAAKIRLFFVDLAVTCGYFVFIQLSGLSHAAKVFVGRSTHHNVTLIGAFLCIVGAGYFVVTIPLRYYRTFALEHRFKLSNQNFSNWAVDLLKETLIGAAIYLLIIEAAYLLIGRAGPLWWLWSALALFLFSILYTRIFPTVIVPLFFKYKTIDSARLRDALIDMSKKAGVNALDVFQIDFSTKGNTANAALAGLGRSKRIILTDTLLTGYAEDEIKVVLAHELAHETYKHTWKIIMVGSCLTLINLYLLSALAPFICRICAIAALDNIEGLPLVIAVLTITNFLEMPLVSSYSRAIERQADLSSLKVTGDKRSFISCMRKLAVQNLSDYVPGRLTEIMLYNHPPIAKRIRYAQESA